MRQDEFIVLTCVGTQGERIEFLLKTETESISTLLGTEGEEVDLYIVSGVGRGIGMKKGKHRMYRDH